MKRKTYHHGDLRRALLDAALAILAEPGGAAALTLRAVARRAGVTHAAPYRHFEGVEQLLSAVAEEGFWQLSEALEAAACGATDALERHAATGIAYVEFAVSHPAHYRVMFGPELDAAHAGLAEAGAAAFGVLVSSVTSAQGCGAMRAGPPMELALASWSIVHGLASLLIDQRLARTELAADPAALAGTVTRLLIDGLAPR